MENLINVIFELTIYLLPFNSFKNFAVSVGRHLYISSAGTKWKGFGAIVIEEVRPQGREDIPDPCTERATHCEKCTFSCKYRIDLANLVAIPYLKLCWTRLVDISGFPLLTIKPIGPKRLEAVKRTKVLQNLISLAEKDRNVMLIIYNWSVSWKLIVEGYFSRKL